MEIQTKIKHCFIVPNVDVLPMMCCHCSKIQSRQTVYCWSLALQGRGKGKLKQQNEPRDQWLLRHCEPQHPTGGAKCSTLEHFTPPMPNPNRCYLLSKAAFYFGSQNDADKAQRQLVEAQTILLKSSLRTFSLMYIITTHSLLGDSPEQSWTKGSLTKECMTYCNRDATSQNKIYK